MNERVTVWYVDLMGTTYYYRLPEGDRERACHAAKVPDFDDYAFAAWCASATNTPDGMYPYDGGRISPSGLLKIWYTTEEVH